MTELAWPGCLGEAMRRFVEHKRALNRKYLAEERALRLFGKYLEQQAVSGWQQVDSSLIERFLQSRKRSSPRSFNHLLGVLRQFFSWAVSQRLTDSNPATCRPQPQTSRRIPYLFGLREMRALLAAARQLPDNSRAKRRGLVYETVFALLCGLGLRVGEVTRLRLADADFNRSALAVRETKFGKSRFVPMGPKLAARLAAYVQTAHGTAPDPQAPLFSFTPGRPMHPGTISQTFHALLPTLGLPARRGVETPRAHGLRHSFAVATLLRWYREGVNPQSRLLHLATFMGHVSPSSTAVYLTITEELLAEADKRFRDYARPGGTA